MVRRNEGEEDERGEAGFVLEGDPVTGAVLTRRAERQLPPCGLSSGFPASFASSPSHRLVA